MLPINGKHMTDHTHKMRPGFLQDRVDELLLLLLMSNKLDFEKLMMLKGQSYALDAFLSHS